VLCLNTIICSEGVLAFSSSAGISAQTLSTFPWRMGWRVLEPVLLLLSSRFNTDRGGFKVALLFHYGFCSVEEIAWLDQEEHCSVVDLREGGRLVVRVGKRFVFGVRKVIE
jgi:hypothetical protein